MNSMKNRILKSITSFIVLLVISLVPQAADAYSAAANKLLAQVRAATAKYHTEAAAVAAGYIADAVCVPGMGYHYIKGSLIGGGVTERQPEVLLYVDSPNGGRKLVGVEYLDFAITRDSESGLWIGHEAPPNGFVSTNPVLFDGQVFNGPMEGHGPQMPWHYDLHVWVWSNNPAGTFATLNPNITCQ